VVFVRVVALTHTCHTLSCALFRVPRAVSRVARAVRTRCHVLVSCVNHMCRAVSACHNKLFSFIITHVNNVNSSGHMF
jgi:hypothetical protein